MYTQRITWEPMRSVDAATLTGVAVALGTPLAFPSYKLKMVNNSTSLVTVSIDGVTAIDVCPANSFWLYDESLITQSVPAVPQGTQIFITGAAGVGSIYLVTQYVILN